MPPQQFTMRPRIVEYVQWTGNNFAEIQQWVKPPAKVTKNPDNTLTYYSPAGHPPVIVHITDWVGDTWIATDEGLREGSSPIDGTPPFAYTVTDTPPADPSPGAGT